MSRRNRRNKIKKEDLNINSSVKDESNLSKVTLKVYIDNLLEYYKSYPNNKRVKDLETIKQHLDNQEYKIAVVANMSSGKSTFINALFGEEVLPAFNHATTDCATFIYSKSNIDKRVVIYFSDKKKPVEIIDNLEDEIKQYAQKDAECENEKHKNVEKIELYYPFKNLQTSSSEDFSITFVDTPGPNSTGEEYKQKHKDQTRSVLNDVDLALFMFDYTQLDANLSSDEQGLWNTIKKRHDKDKDFDVYFLLNKIDCALDDNFKEIDTKDKDEFIELKKKNWKIHEKIAIDKLQKAAMEHGMAEPKIYPIASKFQLLSRDNNINWDAEDELDAFQKSHFKRLFGSEWEEKFIEYIGISKLEKDINSYINFSVKNKILSKICSAFYSIINEEKQYIEQKINVLEKPKEEAEENLNKAIMFLQNKADKIEGEFKEKSNGIQRKYIDSIKKIIDDNIDKELKKNTEEATNRMIKFLELLLEGYSEKDATSDAKNLPKEKIKDHLDKENIKIKVTEKLDVESMEKTLQNFIKSLLNDYKNNYLDMKIDVKNNYRGLSKDIINLFNKYKKEFDKELNSRLNIKNIDLDENSLYNEGAFSEDIKIPDSTIDYNHKNEKWDEGGSFSSRKKIRDEEHSIIISPSNIKKIFELSIESMKRAYYNGEIKIYEGKILEYIKFYQRKFNDFKEVKKRETEQIQKDLKNAQENLEAIRIQYNEFNKIQKKIEW